MRYRLHSAPEPEFCWRDAGRCVFCAFRKWEGKRTEWSRGCWLLDCFCTRRSRSPRHSPSLSLCADREPISANPPRHPLPTFRLEPFVANIALNDDSKSTVDCAMLGRQLGNAGSRVSRPGFFFAILTSCPVADGPKILDLI